MESIKFLVKLSAIVWTKAMDQNLVVSKVLQGAALQAVTKIHRVGKFVKVFIWVCEKQKKQAGVPSPDNAVLMHLNLGDK